MPSPTHPVVFYSNQKGTCFRLLFSRVLHSARRSIFLNMYGLTDPDMLHILSDRARSGLDVCVVYDKKASSNLKKILPREVHTIPSVGAGLMHQKLVVIDDASIFLGSANMTTPSLHMHDNFVVGLYDPCLAEALKRGEGSPIEGVSCEVWQLPDVGGKALARIISLLDSAENSLFLAMFTLTHTDLVDALIRAHRRGVQVEVALDGYTARGASKGAASTLRQAGISLYLGQGESLLHHKWVYIDKKIVVAGSTNWTRSAFVKNRDVFLIINLPHDKMEWMEHLCATIMRGARYDR